jgi:hypothetical protein
VARACVDFMTAYVRNSNVKAGYYFLWLLKEVTGCAYDIPEKEIFNGSTVPDVLSQFFASNGEIKNPIKLVEIFQYQEAWNDRPLCLSLNSNNLTFFENIVAKLLQEVPIDNWPGKRTVIINFLKIYNHNERLAIAKDLVKSEDTTTSKIGEHLQEALLSSSLNEAIPHFYALQELLGRFDCTIAHSAFGKLFVEFQKNKAFFPNDPAFIKRLNFNEMEKVFVHDSLMIGVYDIQTTFLDKQVSSYLIAYDKNTEKMIWGIPLNPGLTHLIWGPERSRYCARQVGNQIALQFLGEKKVYFINPNTGAFDFTIELPEALEGEYNDLYISKNGFIYQDVERGADTFLIGGKIENQQWSPLFEFPRPSGDFLLLSTHCGIREDFEETLVLFSPKGKQIVIESCIDAIAQDDKLYCLVRDGDKCLLTVRTLKEDDEVVSEIEKSIEIDRKKVSFGKLCQNGKIVLFSDNSPDFIDSGKSPIFIDLATQNITYCEREFHSNTQFVIDADLSEVWAWDEESKKIWKVSRDNITLMGVSEIHENSLLLDVDENFLYLADIYC